jgi:hypothetical protein
MITAVECIAELQTELGGLNKKLEKAALRESGQESDL